MSDFEINLPENVQEKVNKGVAGISDGTIAELPKVSFSENFLTFFEGIVR